MASNGRPDVNRVIEVLRQDIAEWTRAAGQVTSQLQGQSPDYRQLAGQINQASATIELLTGDRPLPEIDIVDDLKTEAT
jgi:hypothetical protein